MYTGRLAELGEHWDAAIGDQHEYYQITAHEEYCWGMLAAECRLTWAEMGAEGKAGAENDWRHRRQEHQHLHNRRCRTTRKTAGLGGQQTRQHYFLNTASFLLSEPAPGDLSARPSISPRTGEIKTEADRHALLLRSKVTAGRDRLLSFICISSWTPRSRLSLQRRRRSGRGRRLNDKVLINSSQVDPEFSFPFQAAANSFTRHLDAVASSESSDRIKSGTWHLCKQIKTNQWLSFLSELLGAVRGADSKSAILLGNAPKQNLWSGFCALSAGGRGLPEPVERLLCCLNMLSWLKYTVQKRVVWKSVEQKSILAVKKDSFYFSFLACSWLVQLVHLHLHSKYFCHSLLCVCFAFLEAEPAAVSSSASAPSVREEEK